MKRNNINIRDLSSSDAKKYIRKLTIENRRLNREIEELKHEIDELNGTALKKRKRNKYQIALDKRADYEYMFSKRNYISFMFANLKHTSLFNIYKRFVNVIRRYSFFTISFKIISVLFLMVETATLFVLSTSAFVVSIILTVITSQILMLFTLFVRKKSLKNDLEHLKDKSVTVFFPPKNRAFDIDSYLAGSAISEAGKKDSAVVIVSPFSFKTVGINASKHPYFVSRHDGDNILLVRRYYYFSLKKHILDKYSSQIVEIY